VARGDLTHLATILLVHSLMPFAIDSDVVVKSLRKTGRVVEAGRGGRYRVRVGAVLMLCHEEDLGEVTAGDRGRKRRQRAGAAEGDNRAEALFHTASASQRRAHDNLSPSAADRRRLGALDLHGYTVEEAVSKVEERLDLALRAGLEGVDIIHGRSSGRIKVAVRCLLRELSAVRHFELSRDNPGVTRVFF
jgi:dsDNA-specific endonuclease/ATPase MutS2